MTDYIKREDVYDQLDRWARDLNNPQVYQRDDARCIIDGIPSADVAPVRHAKWEGCKGDITCSACGEYALYDSEDIEMQYRTLYCPFCGARMDAKK